MDQCFRKCVTKYDTPDLNGEEVTCDERCVKKYLQVNDLIQKRLQEIMEHQQKQQQKMQELQQTYMGQKK
jgi:hypothetical protein